jgi:hypothetical protein
MVCLTACCVYAHAGFSHPEPPATCKRVPYNAAMGTERLPGADIIEAGLSDLAAGIESEQALLVAIGAPRLRQLGVEVPATPPDPEHRLYRLLASVDADAAHGRYNALLRRLVSYERALACAS